MTHEHLMQTTGPTLSGQVASAHGATEPEQPMAGGSAQPRPSDEERLLRIQEVAAEVGLTTRSIRYYEELGLLSPAARSGGAYRLYDASDLERLRFIKGLRDDAGFSLAEIGQMLEDEAARQRGRVALKTTEDPNERRAILCDSIERLDRQIEHIRIKIGRLRAMVDEADARRSRLLDKMAAIDTALAETPAAGRGSAQEPR